VSFSPKNRQKKVFAGLEAFFIPKMAQNISLRGEQKLPREGPKYCPLTFRAYGA